jgi:hypothetical protein
MSVREEIPAAASAAEHNDDQEKVMPPMRRSKRKRKDILDKMIVTEANASKGERESSHCNRRRASSSVIGKNNKKNTVVNHVLQRYGQVANNLGRCMKEFRKVEEEISKSSTCTHVMKHLLGNVVKMPRNANALNLFKILVVSRDTDNLVSIEVFDNTKKYHSDYRRERSNERYQTLLKVLETFMEILDENNNKLRMVRACLRASTGGNQCRDSIMTKEQLFNLFLHSREGYPKEKPYGDSADEVVAYNHAIFFRLRHFLLSLEKTLAQMKSETNYRKMSLDEFKHVGRLKPHQYEELMNKVEIETAVTKWKGIHKTDPPKKPVNLDRLERTKQINIAQAVVAPMVTKELLGGKDDFLKPVDEVMLEGISLREALEKHFNKKDQTSNNSETDGKCRMENKEPGGEQLIDTDISVQTFDLERNNEKDGPTIVGVKDVLSSKTSRWLTRFFNERPFVVFPTSGGYGRVVVTDVPYPNTTLKESSSGKSCKFRESTESRDVSRPIKVEVSGKNSIQSVSPHPIERLLLQLGHAIISKYVINIKLLMNCWGIDTSDIHAQIPNGAIIKFGKQGFYNGHQDTSPILVSGPGEDRIPCQFNNEFLPTQGQMIVCTLVLGDQEHGVPNANVVWAGSPEAVDTASRKMKDYTSKQVDEYLQEQSFRKSQRAEDRVFGAFQCSGFSFLHNQLINVNSRCISNEGKEGEESNVIYHGSYKCGAYHLVRGVITFRMLLTTKDGKYYKERVRTSGGTGMGINDYSWFNVAAIAKKCNRNGDGGWPETIQDDEDSAISDNTTEPEEPVETNTIAFRKREVVDRYLALPLSKLELFFEEGDPVLGDSTECPPISRLSPLHGTNSSESTRFIQWLSNKRIAINAFTEHDTIFNATVDGVDVTSIPTHPHWRLPCYPGQHFKSSEFAGIVEINNRKKEFVSSNPAKANFVTAHHLFKQEGKSYADMERNADHFCETMSAIWSKCMAQKNKSDTVPLPTLNDVLTELKNEGISINSLFNINLSLVLTGSGGSSVDSGSNPSNVAKMRRDDALTRAPCKQNISTGPNHAMDRNSELERVIGCFMNTTTFSKQRNMSEGECDLKYLVTASVVNQYNSTNVIEPGRQEEAFYKLAAEYFLANTDGLTDTEKRKKEDECKQYVKKNSEYFNFKKAIYLNFDAKNVFSVQSYIKIFIQWQYIRVHYENPFQYVQVPSPMEFNTIKVTYLELEHYYKKKGHHFEVNMSTAKLIDNDVIIDCYCSKNPPGWQEDLLVGSQEDKEDEEDKAIDNNKSLAETIRDNNNYAFDLKGLMCVGLLVNGASSLRSDINNVMYTCNDTNIFSINESRGSNKTRNGNKLFTKSSRQLAGYLKGKESRRLHSTLRSKPTPMCSRGLDVNVCYFRHWSLQAMLKMGARNIDPQSLLKLHENKDGSLTQESHKMLMELLFMSTLFTFTGKVAYFDDYKSQLKDNDTISTAVPMREDIEKFLLYIWTQFATNQTNGKTTNDQNPSIARLVSAQHNAMIPDGLKRYAGLSKFLKELHRKFDGFDSSKANSRGQVLNEYTKFVMECGDSRSMYNKKDNIKCLCNFAMLNVEEIIHEPFGKISSAMDITLGFGGRQGLTSGRPIYSDEEKYSDLFNESESILANGNPSLDERRLQKIHQVILAHFRDQKDNEDFLFALGWKKKEGKDSVRFVSVANGREYNVADTEHLFCKVWILTASCHCGRSSSKHPNPTAPHCWPAVSFNNSDNGWYVRLLPILKEMSQKCVELLENSSDSVVYPLCLLRNGEEPVTSWLAKGEIAQNIAAECTIDNSGT